MEGWGAPTTGTTSRQLDLCGPLRASSPFHINSFGLTLTEEELGGGYSGPGTRAPGGMRASGMAYEGEQSLPLPSRIASSPEHLPQATYLAFISPPPPPRILEPSHKGIPRVQNQRP